jgi:hypothetical protein
MDITSLCICVEYELTLALGRYSCWIADSGDRGIQVHRGVSQVEARHPHAPNASR